MASRAEVAESLATVREQIKGVISDLIEVTGTETTPAQRAAYLAARDLHAVVSRIQDQIESLA
jgi:hypothetical protein